MCIRDRAQIEEAKKSAQLAILDLDSLSEFADPDAMEELNPVSYTHLRAHETVLDLVCRLLLEKKKTQHQITRS